MEKSYSRKHVASSMAWRFGERILAQLTTFIVSVVLARKLSASDFGNVALLMVFVDVFNVFVVHGFSSALVQKKDPDTIDYSSVLFFSLFVAMLFYAFAYFAAPLLARMGDALLPVLFRVLALRLPIGAINSVQHAYVQKNMDFRKFFFSSLIGTLLSAVVGISMAYSGYGAWSIVAQYLTNSLCDTIVLAFTIDWRPKLVMDLQRLTQLLKFGWKVLFSQLVHVVFQRLTTFFVGMRYSSSDLAYYEQGQKIPGIFETNVDTTINSVLFPVMANAQNEPERLKLMIRRSIQTSSAVIWPMMIGIAVLADQLLLFVYTDKWLPSTAFMMIAAIKLGFEPAQSANLQAIKAVGRSDLYLKMEIAKKTYGILTLLMCVRISVLAVAIAAASQALFSAVVNGVVNCRLFHYSITEQADDILKSFLLSALMGFAVWGAKIILPYSVPVLFAEILIGVAVYVTLSYIWNKSQITYLLSIMRSFRM